MTLTDSETLFSNLCAARKVRCIRIEEGSKRTADYEIILGQLSAFVEIKQLDFNDRDREVERQMDEGGMAGAVAPTRRVRDQIAKAYNQLKAYSKRGYPCLIVLYNNAGLLNDIDSFTVTSAMFGEFGVHLSQDNSQIIHVAGHGFLGGRKVTRNTCRGISAVCVLKSGGSQGLRITAYHNPYAINPIEPAVLALLATSQLCHDDPHGGQFVPLLPHDVRG